MVAVGVLIAALAGAQAAAESPGRIAGRVTVEATSTPIASARVILLPGARPAGPFGPPPQAMTDQDGRFAFDRVAPGDYRLQVQKNGYASTTEMSGVAVHVAAGQSIDNFDLHLQRGGVIAGRVLDALGEPVTDARVMALRHLESSGGSPNPIRWVPAGGPGAQTNDLGEFRVSGLAAGEYLIGAMPQMTGAALGAPGIAPPAATARPSRPATVATTTYYPGTVDQASAQLIVVAAGSEVGNIVFTMQSAAAYRVSGVVVDEIGAPVGGAFVMLVRDPRGSGGMFFGGPPLTGHSQDDGRFTIDGVTAGTYNATASIPMVTGGVPVTGGIVNGAAVGGPVGGVAAGGVSGGVMTWSVGGPGMATPQQTEVVVGDANVSGVRVVARRPQ